MNKFFHHFFFSIASDTECNGHTHNSSQSYYWLLMLWVFCVWLMALRYLRAHVGGMWLRHTGEELKMTLMNFFVQAITFLPRYASLSRDTTHNYQIPLKYLKYLSPAKSSFRTLTGTPQELDAESMTRTLLRTWLVSCQIHFSQYFLFLILSPLHTQFTSLKKIIDWSQIYIFWLVCTERLSQYVVYWWCIARTVKLISRIEARQQDRRPHRINTAVR